MNSYECWNCKVVVTPAPVEGSEYILRCPACGRIGKITIIWDHIELRNLYFYEPVPPHLLSTETDREIWSREFIRHGC